MIKMQSGAGEVQNRKYRALTDITAVTQLHINSHYAFLWTLLYDKVNLMKVKVHKYARPSRLLMIFAIILTASKLIFFLNSILQQSLAKNISSPTKISYK